ncbi:MAG: peptidoglycan editing factor PgeF [Lachnospiraceae bacterium]|nr:peptidoglycan editing factor PgeF [Lachnospiraceae bacterium]
MDIKWMNEQEKGMTLHRRADMLWLSFPELDAFSWLKNGYSTRFGGVSEGDYASLNFSISREGSPEHVKENYRRFAETLELNPEHLVCTQQTHTATVIRVGRNEWGNGYGRKPDWTDVDGLITNEPDVVLAIQTADCVPLYFVDPVHHAIGLSHSGWRGTAAGIGRVTIGMMQKEFGSDPREMYAAIGPCVCQDCYEVDEPCAKNFPGCYTKPLGNGKYLLDLQGVNRGMFAEAGIPVSHIAMPNICTCCNPDLLFSHRASHGRCGTNCGILAMVR